MQSHRTAWSKLETRRKSRDYQAPIAPSSSQLPFQSARGTLEALGLQGSFSMSSCKYSSKIHHTLHLDIWRHDATCIQHIYMISCNSYACEKQIQPSNLTAIWRLKFLFLSQNCIFITCTVSVKVEMRSKHLQVMIAISFLLVCWKHGRGKKKRHHSISYSELFWYALNALNSQQRSSRKQLRAAGNCAINVSM